MNNNRHNYPCVEKTDLRSAWIFGVDQKSTEARANLFGWISVFKEN